MLWGEGVGGSDWWRGRGGKKGAAVVKISQTFPCYNVHARVD